MAVVTMKQLLEAGVHFGHQTRRWNPKMRRFIFGERNGIYILDLNQTLERIDVAYSFVRDLVARGGVILFVGTKKQTQDAIATYARRCGMPYVNERWLGGMLTNFSTISTRIRRLEEFERQKAAGELEGMPKKEALILSREMEKLEKNLGGMRNLTKVPDAIFVIDTKKEHIAVTEANRLGIPVVAVVDTNCDPDVIDYVIPGNDDAIRAGALMCRIVSDAVLEGRYIAERRGGAPRPAPTAVRDPAAEERRAAEQAEARRQAAQEAAAREARLALARSGRAGTESEPGGETASDRPAEATGSASDALSPASESPASESPASESPASESRSAEATTGGAGTGRGSAAVESGSAPGPAGDGAGDPGSAGVDGDAKEQ
jgi:small subunit ribosomal protein S2